MRKPVRAVVLAFVSVLASAVLGIVSAFMSAISVAAVALIVPGTGTPDANVVAGYRQNARDYYMQGTACSDEANCPARTNLIGINYPASFFPLVIIPNWCRSGPDGCDTWDVSVGKGTTALDGQLDSYLKSTDEDVVVFGYSQGGAVVSNALQYLGSSAFTQAQRDRVSVVTIGGIQNPDGGLWPRLSFLNYIPFFDISFKPPMAPDVAEHTTAIAFQYDPVTSAPLYWGNPFAMLNAVAAFDTVHGYYLAPNGNGPTDTLPYGYTPDTLRNELTGLTATCGTNRDTCRNDRYGNTYVIVPATSLPIFDLVKSIVPSGLRPIVQPVINLLTPVTKLLVDLGYDWSGDPSVVRPLSLLPFNPLTFNPIQFSAQFVAAIAQGIQDAFSGSTPAPVPATAGLRTARTMTTPVNAAPTDSLPTLVDQQAMRSNDSTPPTLTVVKDEQPGSQGNAEEAGLTLIGSGAPTVDKNAVANADNPPAKASGSGTTPGVDPAKKTEPVTGDPDPKHAADVEKAGDIEKTTGRRTLDTTGVKNLDQKSPHDSGATGKQSANDKQSSTGAEGGSGSTGAAA